MQKRSGYLTVKLSEASLPSAAHWNAMLQLPEVHNADCISARDALPCKSYEIP
jgi:hypothetical protein